MSSPKGLLPKSLMARRVNDLRLFDSPSCVYVYRANPDGTKGELLRTEPYQSYNKEFINQHRR